MCACIHSSRCSREILTIDHSCIHCRDTSLATLDCASRGGYRQAIANAARVQWAFNGVGGICTLAVNLRSRLLWR